MSTFVVNDAVCSRCGHPRTSCTCKIWDRLADADARAKSDNRQFLFLPTTNLGESVTGPTVWEQERDVEEEVRKENFRRLAAISKTEGSVDAPLPLPTVNWAEWAAEDRQARSEPCHNCPDADEGDYLPLPKL